jgi:hypothetical protein
MQIADMLKSHNQSNDLSWKKQLPLPQLPLDWSAMIE